MGGSHLTLSTFSMFHPQHAIPELPFHAWSLSVLFLPLWIEISWVLFILQYPIQTGFFHHSLLSLGIRHPLLFRVHCCYHHSAMMLSASILLQSLCLSFSPLDVVGENALLQSTSSFLGPGNPLSHRADSIQVTTDQLTFRWEHSS